MYIERKVSYYWQMLTFGARWKPCYVLILPIAFTTKVKKSYIRSFSYSVSKHLWIIYTECLPWVCEHCAKVYSLMGNHSYTAKSRIMTAGDNIWNCWKEIFFYKIFLVDSRFSLLQIQWPSFPQGPYFLWPTGEDSGHLGRT